MQFHASKIVLFQYFFYMISDKSSKWNIDLISVQSKSLTENYYPRPMSRLIFLIFGWVILWEQLNILLLTLFNGIESMRALPYNYYNFSPTDLFSISISNSCSPIFRLWWFWWRWFCILHDVKFRRSWLSLSSL